MKGKVAMKRIFSVITILLMLFTMIPATSFAADNNKPVDYRTASEEWINPLYQEISSDFPAAVQNVPDNTGSVTSAGGEDVYHTSYESAANEIRSKLAAHDETIVVKYKMDYSLTADEYWSSNLSRGIYNCAIVHNGCPSEGDAIGHAVYKYKANLKGFSDGDYLYVTITYTFTYLHNAAQEAELREAIANLKTQLNLDGKTDYEKIKAIYDYMCANITYDYDNLKNDEYMQKYSAYAALINKTAVCEGYAVLFYRLALEHGLDARIISGIANGGGHAWNIVKLGDKYYNLDSTWDAPRTEYGYFLKGSTDFPDHEVDIEFTTAEFKSKYPISEKEYKEPEHVHSFVIKSEVIAPTCTKDGYTIYTCVCGDTQIKDKKNALGHNVVVDKAVAATCTSPGLTEGSHCTRCSDMTVAQRVTPALGHVYEGKITTVATCTADGVKTFTCKNDPKHTYTEAVPKLKHSYDSGVVTKEPTIKEPGEKLFTCSRCGDTYTREIAALDRPSLDTETVRYAGSGRYETAMLAADVLKDLKGVSKFDAILVASGMNYPDALAGSYLAKAEDAPILLVGPGYEEKVKDYIVDNLASDGKVYILGGTGVVTPEFEASLKNSGITVDRRAGAGRYETNISILEAANATEGDLLVCAGTGFADSLSASAAGLPIMLVGSTMTSVQTDYLDKMDVDNIYLVGGLGAVSADVEEYFVERYGRDKVIRFAGKTRYETSAMVAEAFYPEAESAVLAYALNFPDGLSGGSVAMALGAPLLLVDNNAYSAAETYADKAGINSAVILGGPTLISDDVANKIIQ